MFAGGLPGRWSQARNLLGHSETPSVLLVLRTSMVGAMPRRATGTLMPDQHDETLAAYSTQIIHNCMADRAGQSNTQRASGSISSARCRKLPTRLQPSPAP